MTTDKAIERMKECVDLAKESQGGPVSNRIDMEALSHLTKLAEEHERLRAFYYGNPGSLSVVADQLHIEVLEKENASLKAEVEDYQVACKDLEKAYFDIANLKAEVERLKEQLRIVHRELRHECEVAEKAEAELEKVKDNLGTMAKNRDYWFEKTQKVKAKWVDTLGDHVAVSEEATQLQAKLEKAEAELEKARPLLEAAGQMTEDDLERIGNTVDAFAEYVPISNYKCPGRVLKDKFLALLKAIRERKGEGKPFDDNLSPEERAKEEQQLKDDEIERRHERSLEDSEEKEAKP